MTAPTWDEIAAGDFCSVERAAQRLGLDVSTVYRMADRGVLSELRATAGRARRISVVSLDHFIASNLTHNKTPAAGSATGYGPPA